MAGRRRKFRGFDEDGSGGRIQTISLCAYLFKNHAAPD